MKNNKIYYHFYIPNSPSHWEFLLYEQLDLIEGSLLFEECDIEMCVSSNEKNYKKLLKIINLYKFIKCSWFDSSIQKNKEHYEGTTLLKLHNECNLYKNVGYIHSKGITNLTKYTNKWRKIMEYGVIEEWKNNIKALEDGHDVSGIFWFKNGLFFSGNFWWAKSQYIKKLPIPILGNWNVKDTKIFNIYKNKINLDAFKSNNRIRYEFWIGLNNPKVNEVHEIRSITGLYGYDLDIKRKTIINFPSEKNIIYI